MAATSRPADDRYIRAARRAGCPPDQLRNFLRARTTRGVAVRPAPGAVFRVGGVVGDRLTSGPRSVARGLSGAVAGEGCVGPGRRGPAGCVASAAVGEDGVAPREEEG